MANRSKNYRNSVRNTQKNAQRAERIREKGQRWLSRMNAHRVAWAERQKERIRRYRESFGTPGWLGLTTFQKMWAFVVSLFQPSSYRNGEISVPKRTSLTRRLVMEGMEQRQLLAGDVFISGKANTFENLDGNFVISMPTAEATDVTVEYTLGGTAIEDDDYPPQTGVATIAAGQTFVNLPIVAALDGILEPTETVSLTLTGTNSSGGLIGSPASDSILIFDGDSRRVAVSVLDGFVSEVGDQDGAFELSLVDILDNSLTSTTDTTVTLGIGGTATPSDDYTAISTTWVIPAGSSVVTVPFSAINDTVNFDDGETVVLSVVDVDTPHPSLSAGPDTATITITDTTRPIASITALSPSADEATPETTATFQIGRNR